VSYNPLDDLDVMALTLLGEARGESIIGQHAVAHVIFNRYKNPRWWSRDAGDNVPDDTIAAVCLDPFQFSCWYRNDPNYPKLIAESTKQLPLFAQLKEVCRQVLTGVVPDPTKGCDHYCTTKIAKFTKWAKGRKPIAVIGNHSFFKIEL